MTALNRRYDALENRYAPRANRDYERLVVAADNQLEPVHRWFHMKEAFSPSLFARLVKDYRLDNHGSLRVLDPFSGSGTTTAAALQHAAQTGVKTHAVGYEVNPFLHLLSTAKSEVLATSDSRRLALAREVEATAVRVIESAVAWGSVSSPILTTFQNKDYFPEGTVETLSRLSASINALEAGGVQRLLLIALAAAVEPSSRLRRDGRALRFVSDKRPLPVMSTFAAKCRQIAADLRLVAGTGAARISLSDGRRMRFEKPSSTDLAIFSPPYPNNIDYTEIYKLESWILRLFNSQVEFKNQRMRTLRSHPSISWRLHHRTDNCAADLAQMLADVRDSIPDGRYSNQREQVLCGYLADMHSVFRRLWTILKPGGYAIFVVGNSTHGSGDDGFVYAADLLLGEVAEFSGFTVESIQIARYLRRRERSRLGRESVVVLRKSP